MEIDITKFVREACPKDYSASQMEIGADAGPATWRAACEDAEEYRLLDTQEKLDGFRRFARSSGGWDDEEIAAWTDTEVNALCLQWVSGDMREAGLEMGATQAQWEAAAEDPNGSGSLFVYAGVYYFSFGDY